MTNQYTDPGDPSIETTLRVADAADPEVTMDRLTKVYIKMRDAISELESKITHIKEQQDEIAMAMKDQLRATGGDSIRTPHGTVTLKTDRRYFTEDWDSFYKFLLEHQLPQLLEKRIAQTNMTAFLEANPQSVPPGLNTKSEISVTVRKPGKN